MNNFGEKLKRLREENAFTQDDVARKLNVTRQSVSNWENNKNLPDLTLLVTLSQLYNISLDNLVREEKNVVKSIKHQLHSYRTTALVTLLIFAVLAFLLPVIGIYFSIKLLRTKKNTVYATAAKILGITSLIWQIIPLVIIIMNFGAVSH